MTALQTPLERFFYWAERRPERVFLQQGRPGQCRELSWAQAADQVRRLAAALQAWGLQPGQRVLIASANSPEWLVAEQAIALAGGVSVALYPRQPRRSVRFVVEQADVQWAFLGAIAGQDEIEAGLRDGLRRIAMPSYAGRSDFAWADALSFEPYRPRALPAAGDLWSIIYTSGSLGLPKGIELSHGAVAYAVGQLCQEFDIQADEQFFSYLPLAHIAERSAVLGVALYAGARIRFLQDIDSFAQELADTQPSRFFAVPMVWNKLRAEVLVRLPAGRLNRLLRVPLLGAWIAARLRRRLGLGRVRSAHSGAAPLPRDLQLWFQRLGVDILQAYGLTENLAYVSAVRRGAQRIGSCGQVLPGVECRLGEQDELLTRSPAQMLRCHRDPEATAELLDGEGWIHTGDTARWDAEGHLYITGRVKDLFKTLKGKYVAPWPMESALLSLPWLEYVCVLGRGLAQPFALVQLDPSAIRGLSQDEQGEALEALRQQLNARLEAHEALSHCFVIADSWTPESGLLTPTLKPRRQIVEAVYQSALEPRLADRDNTVQWLEAMDSLEPSGAVDE